MPRIVIYDIKFLSLFKYLSWNLGKTSLSREYSSNTASTMFPNFLKNCGTKANSASFSRI